MLLSDLEGVCGISSIDEIDHSSDIFQNSRRLLTEDINVAVDACINAGGKNVYVIDGHAGGENVIDTVLDRRAKLVNTDDWRSLLKNGNIDAQIELGCHAMAGTLNGFLDHTLSSKQIFEYKINGKAFSELGIHAIFCGAYNVPIIACSGDTVACNQAKEFIPNIVCAEIKKSVSRNICAPFCTSEARAVLREQINKSIVKASDIKPFKVELPLTIEITYYRSDFCDNAYAKSKNNVERVNARTLRKTIEKIDSYYDLRF